MKFQLNGVPYIYGEMSDDEMNQMNGFRYDLYLDLTEFAKDYSEDYGYIPEAEKIRNVILEQNEMYHYVSATNGKVENGILHLNDFYVEIVEIGGGVGGSLTALMNFVDYLFSTYIEK